MSNTKETPTWLSVDDFCRKHSWARPGTLRHCILHAPVNGFHRCIRRAGRRIFLIEPEVFAWFERRGALATAKPDPK